MLSYGFYLVLSAVLFIYAAKDWIVSLFTSDDQIQSRILSLIWIQCITQFPDTYKGLFRGIFKALGIQHKAVYISFSGQWLINIFLIWYLAFHLKMGHLGVLSAKMVMEYYICISFFVCSWVADWNEAAKVSKKR